MKVWSDYAMIKDGVVQTVACFLYGEYTKANMMAIELYGQEAIAVDVSQIPTQAGDRYVDGVFYRGESIIEAFPTEEEQVAQNTEAITQNANDISDANDAIDELIIAITPREVT